jgi:hypothetical protein
MGYLDFWGLLLEEELAVREERRLRHALRISKMPHHKTIDGYDFSYQHELDPRRVRDLATLAFVEAKANAALLGPPGVGKTHIAVALAVAACRAGFTIYFTTLDDRWSRWPARSWSSSGICWPIRLRATAIWAPITMPAGSTGTERPAAMSAGFRPSASPSP